MYIGSTSSRGLHHLVYEIVDNAVDEALAGFCSEIKIDINEGDTITVIDNGRGIPVAEGKGKILEGTSFVCSVLKGRSCSDSNRGRSYQTAPW